MIRFESPERYFKFTNKCVKLAVTKLRLLKLTASQLLFVAILSQLSYHALQLNIMVSVITEDGTHLKHRRPCQ